MIEYACLASSAVLLALVIAQSGLAATIEQSADVAMTSGKLKFIKLDHCAKSRIIRYPHRVQCVAIADPGSEFD